MTPSSSIPEAAVEAAAIAWVGEYVWQDCNHAWRADYLERTRIMLEAAVAMQEFRDTL